VTLRQQDVALSLPRIAETCLFNIVVGGMTLNASTNREVQNVREEQAVALYEKTVLTALTDVENALVV